MVQKDHIVGYENFCKFMDNFNDEGKVVHILFSGSKDPNTGESWCDDCVRAWPIIEKALENAESNLHFIYVEVGDRPTWKDPNSSFRKDKRTNLMVLPTIVKWKGFQKLVGDQCENPDLVSMLFNDED